MEHINHVKWSDWNSRFLSMKSISFKKETSGHQGVLVLRILMETERIKIHDSVPYGRDSIPLYGWQSYLGFHFECGYPSQSNGFPLLQV